MSCAKTSVIVLASVILWALTKTPLFVVVAPAIVLMAARRRSHSATVLASALVVGALGLFPPLDVRFQQSGTIAVALVPIVWGLPDRSAMLDAKEGRVVLGGCMVPSRAPRWALLVSY